MITLITGGPGAGKTAALVKLLREMAKGRAIFCDGIPDLKIPHVPLVDARKWHEEVPDGAAIVIDEVQRVWRPAGAGQRIPEDIALLETHRHRGLDFFIVTQHPKLVHSNVRNLVGRHVHLRDIGVLGRWWYEWPEAVDPGSWKTAPVKKRYRLDKASFALYKSASEHIKPIRSIPPSVMLFAGALVALGVVGWYTYRSVSSKVGTPSKAVASVVSGTPATVLQSGPRPGAPVTVRQLQEMFVPRLPWKPETAPAYDALRVVTAMPKVVGGYCQGNVCHCQNNQGLDAGITGQACREWIANPPFDPYRVQSGPPAAAGSVQGSTVQPAPSS